MKKKIDIRRDMNYARANVIRYFVLLVGLLISLSALSDPSYVDGESQLRSLFLDELRLC